MENNTLCNRHSLGVNNHTKMYVTYTRIYGWSDYGGESSYQPGYRLENMMWMTLLVYDYIIPGEKVLIPINMRDGSVLAIGKGNAEWNFSAPHGAGRLMSRTKAKTELNMNEYKNVMQGIYTTSINENTLDEAPMAYKRLDDIIDVIGESVDVIDVMKPIYNFKASE